MIDEQEKFFTGVVSEEEATSALRKVISLQVEKGWRIEMQNEFDAILSKKKNFPWFFHILLIVIFFVLFSPLAILWLAVMLIIAVTSKPITKRIWVEKNGEVFER